MPTKKKMLDVSLHKQYFWKASLRLDADELLIKLDNMM